MECSKHRTISIMSQAVKVLLKVVGERLKSKMEEVVDGAQFGFRKNKGTRNAIFVIRMVLERMLEKNNEVYMCFIDYEKAFDTVKHEILIDMLQRMGVDGRDSRLIRNLYWEQEARVRIGEDRSDPFFCSKGSKARVCLIT